MKKVLITGSGRSGTSFLMLIYSYLKQGTGWGDNAHTTLYKNCKSGLEDVKGLDSSNRIIKSPKFLRQLGKFYDKNKKIDILDIIIPVRNLEDVAKSRERHGNQAGGWQNSAIKDKESQIKYVNESYSMFLSTAAKYELPFTLIDFQKMVNDSKYLYRKIKHTFKEDLSYEEFDTAYKKASEHQKK